jgi:hypothetical protein
MPTRNSVNFSTIAAIPILLAISTLQVARADIFIFDALTPDTSYEQLPNSPGGSLLDSIEVFGISTACRSGMCLFDVLPLTPGYTLVDPTFNYSYLLDPAITPPANGLIFAGGGTCPEGPCYNVGIEVVPYVGQTSGIVETGGLQTAPFSMTWTNGTDQYTDTFEFELDEAGVPTDNSAPEPRYFTILIASGLLIAWRRHQNTKRSAT